MTLEIDIAPHALYTPIRTNKQRAAQDAHKLFAVPFPLTPEAPLIEHTVANIGQQWKIQLVLFSKGMVRGKIIRADAVNGNRQGVKLRNSITEFRCFNRSPIGVIFGIGKDDITLP